MRHRLILCMKFCCFSIRLTCWPTSVRLALNFVMRWQQFTGPIVAKGFEDTALYVYHPLLSLNEVGGNPRPRRRLPRSTSSMPSLRNVGRWPGNTRRLINPRHQAERRCARPDQRAFRDAGRMEATSGAVGAVKRAITSSELMESLHRIATKNTFSIRRCSEYGRSIKNRMSH